MQESDIDKIISLAEQKKSHIEEFFQLSEQQTEAISQDNYELVLNIINQKQNIMEQVNLLNLNLQDKVPANNDDILNKIEIQTREIVARALALDDKNIQLLKNNQAKIFEKLIYIQKNKQTHAQYRGKNMKIEGILLDQKK